MNFSTYTEALEALVPAVVTEPQSVEVTAEKLAVGDAYRVSASSVRTVGTVKVGTKRVTVLDENGKEMAYLLKGETVRVGRQVETPESVAAREAGKARAEIYYYIQAAEENYALVTKQLQIKLSEGYVDPRHMTNVAEAGAELKIWSTVAKYIENGADELAAVQEEADSLLSDLLRFRLRGESRSTSQMHNLLEDIEVSAAAKFCKRYAMVTPKANSIR